MRKTILATTAAIAMAAGVAPAQAVQVGPAAASYRAQASWSGFQVTVHPLGDADTNDPSRNNDLEAYNFDGSVKNPCNDGTVGVSSSGSFGNGYAGAEGADYIGDTQAGGQVTGTMSVGCARDPRQFTHAFTLTFHIAADGPPQQGQNFYIGPNGLPYLSVWTYREGENISSAFFCWNDTGTCTNMNILFGLSNSSNIGKFARLSP